MQPTQFHLNSALILLLVVFPIFITSCSDTQVAMQADNITGTTNPAPAPEPANSSNPDISNDTIFLLAYIDDNASPAQKMKLKNQIKNATANIKKSRIVYADDKLTFQLFAAQGFGKSNPFSIFIIASSDLDWIKMVLSFIAEDKTYIINALDRDDEQFTITVPILPLGPLQTTR